MTAKNEWLRVRDLTRKQFRATGGCFWDLDPDSPGHSLRVPQGTAFQIHLEGSKSHRFVHGLCRDCAFVVSALGGETSYSSANRAVNQTRKAYAKATNAYLYISFKVDDRFVLADELRQSSAFGVPLIEAFALRLAKTILKHEHPKLKAEEIHQRAEDLSERSEFIERVRKLMDESD